ncbi:MAG: glycosyltransferase family 39 protein [Candidatus Omnitrophota bacterium]
MLNRKESSHPSSGFAPGTNAVFFLLTVLVFPLYLYHNPARWDAIVSHWPALFYVFRPYTILGHGRDLLLLLILWLIGHGLGKGIFALAHPARRDDLSFAFTIPMGWSVLSFAVFSLSMAQRLNSLAIALTLAILFFASCVFWLRNRAQLSYEPKRMIRTIADVPFYVKLFCLLILVSIFYAFVSSLMPPTQSDGLRYHLSVPKIYLSYGGFVLLPHLAFSNFPFLIEYLYAIPLAFGSNCGPKLIHFSYFVFTLGLLYDLGKNLGGRNGGIFSVLLLAVVPFVPIFSSWSFIEFGLTCYTVMGFIFCLRSIEQLRAGENSKATREAILAGLSGGLILGCKYTSLTTVFFFLFFMLIFAGKGNYRRAAGHAFLAGTIAAVLASPWYVKNLVLLGNPIYPFARSLFPTPYWTDFNAAFFAYHAGLKGNLNALAQYNLWEKILDFATLPARITFFPGEERHFPENFGAWPVGTLWLALAPLLLLRRRWNFRLTALVLFSFILFVTWAYTYRDTRFLLSSMALLAPVLAAGMTELMERPLVRWLLFGMASYGLIFTTGLMLLYRAHDAQGRYDSWGKYDPWLVVSGKISGEQYLEDFNEFTKYENHAFRFLRENTAPHEKTLLHGIEHPFYCPNDFAGADWFNTDPLIAWSWECSTAQELLERLRSEKVRYVIYHYGKIKLPGYYQYYRLFRLPLSLSLPLLNELNKREKMRVQYTDTYNYWLRTRYEEELQQAEAQAPNIAILNQLLDGGMLPEVFRYEASPKNPYEGISVLKVPESAP